MKFNAKAVLLMHEFEKEVEITSIDDIRSYFSPYECEVTQVNLSKYKKEIIEIIVISSIYTIIPENLVMFKVKK